MSDVLSHIGDCFGTCAERLCKEDTAVVRDALSCGTHEICGYAKEKESRFSELKEQMKQSREGSDGKY